MKVKDNHRDPYNKKLKSFLKQDNFDSQNIFCKTCAKNAMLLLDDQIGANKLYNTGVVIGGSEVIKSLRFEEKLNDMNALLDEARDDCLYPIEISKHFVYNNEVYVTYLIEKNNIPYTDMGIQWNFILDKFQKEPVDSAYFFHCVNKEFERTLL
jgi:hypothetical protein